MTLLSTIAQWTLDTLVVDVLNTPQWSRHIDGRKVQCLNGGVIIQRRAAQPRTVQLNVVLAGSQRSIHMAQLETLWATNTGGFHVSGPGVEFDAFIDPEVNWQETWESGRRYITIGLILNGSLTLTGGA